MTELMLLSPGAGGWRAFPLLPIQQADAVIWGASVVQYSADAGSPTAIPGPDEWLVEEPVNLPQDGELIVRADLVEGSVLVYEVVADAVVRPFITDTPKALRFAASKRKGAPSLSIPKSAGPHASVAGKLHSQQSPSFLRLADVAGHTILIWLHEGGQRGWLETIALLASHAADRENRKKNRLLRESGTAFINPYTFVPLPESVHRAAPHGHAGDPELLIGSIDLTYELLTDLVLPSDWTPAGAAEEHITLAGSGLRGAVRTVHEVIAGGCMRVVNLDYTPIHRETTRDAQVANRLAVVTELDASQHVTQIRLSEEPVWVPFTSFEGERTLSSGLRFDLAAPLAATRNPDHGNRLESTAAVSVLPNPNGEWVLHLSDTGARLRHPYWVPLAKLTDDPVVITAEVRKAFEDACLRAEGVDGQLAQSAPAWGGAQWPGVAVVSAHSGRVGRRRRVDGRLGPGDSVWWVPREQRLKMAVMWRKAGTGTVKERMDASLQPCSDPALLCPTCSIFGAAGPDSSPGTGRGDGSHRAYSGHLRFLPAVSTDAVQIHQAKLAPLREPRPSSGGFYLKTTARPEALRGKRGEAKSVWGSALDSPTPRRIAGRKFYWHGQQAGKPGITPDTPRQFHRKPEIEDPARWLVPAGTQFTQRVTFDGVDEAQLALLLCALDPQELTRVPGAPQPKGRLALHFGGGKPLGFGTVVCVEKTVRARRAEARYEGGSPASNTDTALDHVDLHVIDPQAPWLTALVHALDTEFVHADRIHYPFDPETASFERGPTNDAFLQSFQFFAHYNGGYEKKEGHYPNTTRLLYPMVPLPDAADGIQYIDPKPEEAK